MSGEQNWRVPTGSTQAETYFGNQQKKNELADRRPVIKNASDLGLGPGISSQAIRITDFNDPLATYNGYYSALMGAANAPTVWESFLGTTVMDADMGGVQVVTGFTSNKEFKRIFVRNPSDPESISWGAWQVGSGEVAIGSLMPYAGAVAPSGWLLCNGSSYSTTIYADLYAVIGTTFGGSGSTFNVPDLRDRTVYGVGSNWSFAETDGLALASRTMDLKHIHGVTTQNAGEHDHTGVTGQPSAIVNRTFDDANPAAHPNHTHTIPSDGSHYHTGITLDFGDIGATLRGVGLPWIIRHGEF